MELERILELLNTHNVMIFVFFIFIFNTIITIFELIFDFFRKKKRIWNDTGANILIAIFSSWLETTIAGTIIFVGLMFFVDFQMIEIPMNIYSWIGAFILADLTYYWLHRIEHEHRILWAIHSVHHSSKDYNLSTPLRLSIFEIFIEWLFLIPMILLGFGVFQTIAAFLVVVVYQHWIHTEDIKKLGILDKIFNTPSNHRVHHGSNKEYLDKNYGGVLMIWDKIFGTYKKEEKKVIYGLTKNINTNNPIKINIIEFQNIYKDVKKCNTIKDALKIVFGNLSWKPKYFKKE